MTRLDWFFAAACFVMAVSNVIEGDALMAAIAGFGCGLWALIVTDEVTR